MQLPLREVCGKLDEYEREEQWLAKQRKCTAVLRNDHTHRSSNSFNEHFSIPFLILVSHFRCTWTTSPKACGMATNTNMHVLAQRYWDTYMHVLNGHMRDIHCGYIHLVINYVYVIQHQASKRGKNSSDYNFWFLHCKYCTTKICCAPRFSWIDRV